MKINFPTTKAQGVAMFMKYLLRKSREENDVGEEEEEFKRH